MRTLILHPNATAQWVALVQEATQQSQLSLQTDLEHYLVVLLMEYMNRPELTQKVLATDFLTHKNLPHTKSADALQEIGDQCLLYSGWFPKKAKARRISASYYVQLGQQAYDRLSYSNRQSTSKLFSSLCTHFITLMDVLQEIRKLDPHAETLDLLEAEELWRNTNSKAALNVLKQKTQGFFLPAHLVDEFKKH